MSTPSDLVSAIRSVAAGAAVDWSALDAAPADASVVAVLDQLKVIAKIAGAHGLVPTDSPVSGGDEDELQNWGGLTLIERIGEGSYGVVYRAWDSRLDREVALKLLRPGRSRHPASPTIEEGRLLARVHHPNVVTVHGADCIDGRVGIWMEFISGRTLEDIVQADGPLSPGEAARIGIEVAKGLGAVHRAGVVHRDVKAQNVMVQDDGRVVLMDFGSGHMFGDAHSSAAGTPLYVAPEVLAGNPATVRSDIYSLGVLLYRVTTGKYPRAGSTVAELKSHRSVAIPTRQSHPGLPKALRSTIDCALDAEHARFDSADELERALVDRRTVSRSWPTTVTVVVIALAAAAGMFWRRTLTQSNLQPPPHRWVLVGTFENNSGDPALGDTVRTAFDRVFQRSSAVSSVPQDRVTEALALMRRPPTTRLDAQVARDVAQRDGDIEAIVTGRLDKIGAGVVISAEAISPIDGSTLVSVAEPQRPADQMSAAIQREVDRIQASLVGSIHVTAPSGVRLRKVTSPSLRAVQLYSEAASLYPDEGGNWDHVGVQQRLEAALKEDPDFASAHILLAHAIANQDPNCRRSCPDGPEIRAHAERAMQLAGTVTSVERHFIEGSGHSFRARLAPTAALAEAEELAAIAGWDAVLREQPDSPWALQNTEGAYRRLGRTQDMAIELASLADAFPNNFRLSAAAAQAAQHAGDGAAVDRLSARAKRLMTVDQEHEYPRRAAQLTQLLIQRAWLRDEPQAMLDAVNAGAAEAERVPDGKEWMTLYGFYTALTLGRLHDAEVRVAQLPGGPLHDVAFTQLLKRRRDRTGLRAFLTTRIGSTVAPNLYTLWAENGFFDEAERVMRVETANGEPPNSLRMLPLEQSIALHERRTTDAVRLGEYLLRRTPSGDFRHLPVSMMTADALSRLGRAVQAISVLEDSTVPRTASSAEEGYRWMDARAQLAGLYRQVGREMEARAVEEHLLKLLAVADPDDPLLMELKSRVAERGSPSVAISPSKPNR